jgi:hypothetical protein
VNDHHETQWPLDGVLIETEQRENCLVDRRSGFDRRRAYSLIYFANGGIERRQNRDRRKDNDRRRLWEMRGTPCSVTAD